MAKLSVRICYGVGVRLKGREQAARDMAQLFAERLRVGIDKQDAADLADMMNHVANGMSLSVALGFATDGRPSEFDRDWDIYERVEELHLTPLPLKDCYKRIAAAHKISMARAKQIHLRMRRADWVAHHPDED